MVWIMLCALMLALCFREVQDNATKVRYRTEGKEIVSSLEHLFFSAIYPGYRYDKRISFYTSLRRSWWLFGPILLVVRTRFDISVRLDVKNLVTQRVLRIIRNLHKDRGRKPVLIRLAFSSYVTKPSTATKEIAVSANESAVPAVHLVTSDAPPPLDPEMKALIDRFKLRRELTQVAWLCVGGCSANMLSMLCNTLDPAVNEFTSILGANTDTQQLEALFLSAEEAQPRHLRAWGKLVDGRFDIVPIGTEGGSFRDPAKVALLVSEGEVKIRLQKMIKKSKIPIIVANLGGGTGSGTAPEVAKLVAEEGERVGGVAIVMMPLPYEGEVVFDRAQVAHAEITKHLPAITIHNQAIYELANHPQFAGLAAKLKGQSTGVAIREVNTRAVETVLYTLDQVIMRSASTINRDPTDVIKLLRSGQAIYCANFDSRVEEELTTNDTIVEHLLNNTFIDTGIVPNAVIGLVHFSGFSHEDSEYIASKLRSAMQGDDEQKSLELMPGHDDGTDGVRQIFFLAASDQPVDLKKDTTGLNQPMAVIQQTAETSVAALPRASETTASSGPARHMSNLMNPFKQTSLEALRSEFPPEWNGHTRMMKVQFEGDEESTDVWLPRKIIELIQFHEANYISWTDEERTTNTSMLSEFFATVCKATRGKKWLPVLPKAATSYT